MAYQRPVTDTTATLPPEIAEWVAREEAAKPPHVREYDPQRFGQRNAVQEEFDKLYWVPGQDPVLIDNGASLLFPNGAQRDLSWHGGAKHPPHNERERLTKILRYYKVKLNRACDKKDEYQRYVESTKGNVSETAKQEMLAQLKALVNIVKDCEKQYQDAQDALDGRLHGTAEERSEWARMEAAQAAREDQFLAEVRKIGEV